MNLISLDAAGWEPSPKIFEKAAPFTAVPWNRRFEELEREGILVVRVESSPRPEVT